MSTAVASSIGHPSSLTTTATVIRSSGGWNDRTFDLAGDTFDTSFDRHVDAPMIAPVLETGWNLEVAYPRIGHPEDLDDRADLRGFPGWALAGDDASSLAVAHREGSAWSEDNTCFRAVNDFGDEHSDVAWQSLWNPRGEHIEPGDGHPDRI